MNYDTNCFFDRNINNDQMYEECSTLFNNDDELKEFRQYIHETSGGFGDNAHCIMWDRLIGLLPINFRFIEIGVYKGQILALVSKSAKKYNKNCEIYGVTPLTNLGDKYSSYNDVNYLQCIHDIHKRFGLPFSDNQIIQGTSTDANVKSQMLSLGKFDVIYIDGGHDYNTVISDIDLAKQICKSGGYIVTDDSSVFLPFTSNIFRGHEEVSLAVNYSFEGDQNFIEKQCVGHNRIFKKIN